MILKDSTVNGILNVTEDIHLADIGSLVQYIQSLPVIHHGTKDPDNTIGKDGDIYMKIIKKVGE